MEWPSRVWAIIGAVALLGVPACSPSGSDQPAADPDVVDWFADLLAARASGDVWATAAYHHRDLEVVDRADRGNEWTNDLELVPLLDAAIRHTSTELVAVHVGADDVVVVEDWGDHEGAVWRHFEDGRIRTETVFEHLGSLTARLPVSPAIVDTYETLTERWRRVWLDAGSPAEVYAPEATVTVPAVGVTLPAAEALDQLTVQDDAGAEATAWLDPPRASLDPGRAVVRPGATLTGTCGSGLVLRWAVVEGMIEAETWYLDIDGLGDCVATPILDRWRSMPPPLPHHTVVTHTAITGTGGTIAIVNGAPGIDEFVGAAVARFGEVGLTEPRVGSVTFPPVPDCAGRTGLARPGAEGADLLVCTPAADVCPDLDCRGPVADRVRFDLFHELGHAWTFDELDADEHDRFVELVGAEAWNDDSLPWWHQGSEFAAETLAWHLDGRPDRLPRLGDPDPDLLAEAHQALVEAAAG